MGDNRTRRRIVAYTSKSRGEVAEARVSNQNETNGLISYGIRFNDSKGDLAMRANFVKMYDKRGKIIQDRVAEYDENLQKVR